jgi:hypothetical protein
VGKQAQQLRKEPQNTHFEQMIHGMSTAFQTAIQTPLVVLETTANNTLLHDDIDGRCQVPTINQQQQQSEETCASNALFA